RCVIAAQGRPLIDFALRRTQGKDAGMMVARSTYIAGFAGTSNMLAGKVYGMPTSGTMAHSFICAFDSEREAFTAYSETHPQNTILLIDTFDTLEGAHRAVQVAQVLKKRGHSLNGVRLDSGDMIDLSFKVRKILDQSGFSDVKIYASTGFDEFKIAEAVSKDARIDAFGAGTKVGVSSDAPYVDIVYKLVRFKDRNVRKLSTNKTTLAGQKQVFRRSARNGRYVEDVIGDRDETIKGCRRLLIKVMSNGRRVGALNSLQVIRAQFKDNLADLPKKYKALNKVGDFTVKISPRLYAQQNSVHP
ncbi:MAG: nicotinate phosphoribosyltransferase, partial [Desulfobacterales bacterium]